MCVCVCVRVSDSLIVGGERRSVRQGEAVFGGGGGEIRANIPDPVQILSRFWAKFRGLYLFSDFSSAEIEKSRGPHYNEFRIFEKF